MQIRPYEPGDRDAVLEFAERLTIGVAAWRDAVAVRAAAEAWLRDSIDAIGDDGAVFVAEVGGALGGVVSVTTRRHFTGQADAYVGELAVAEGVERRGVGRALMRRAERWAWTRGLRCVSIETGAANDGARRFYENLGYTVEEVTMTRLLDGA